ncbi:GatB/YqeY domain-containing protein [Sediminitomix flava]|nr:GatB/YqeY domain-containing protein [Sediminitomix flava]
MSLKAKVQEGMKTAMKAKQKDVLSALKQIKAEIQKLETAGGVVGEITEEQEMKLLVKMAKQRKDTATTYQESGREDLAAVELKELEVIEEFLPKQMSEEEVAAEIKAIIEETGASSMKDMGKVMGLASKKLAGKADNKKVSDLVKQLLG